MPALIALKLFGSRALSFLGRLNVWQLLCIGLALFATLQHFQLAGERRHSAKLEAQLAKINEAGKAQKRTSERTVEQVVKGDPQTKVIVKTIREAPNPEGCRTPGLETLRDVL